MNLAEEFRKKLDEINPDLLYLLHYIQNVSARGHGIASVWASSCMIRANGIVDQFAIMRDMKPIATEFLGNRDSTEGHRQE